jgi:threonine/homoserine/homoserine lactone efflux protein
MAGGTVAAFWAVSFLFVVTPGADWAYAIAAGLRHRVVLPAVGGGSWPGISRRPLW